jgi:hypothetical protein
MSSILKFSAFLMVLAVFVSTACSKDNPANPAGCAAGFNWGVELQAEATALSNAASVYAQDQTTENCNAYKAAFQAYLDAAADIDVCVPTGQRAEYNAAINDAQANLDALVC